MEHNDDEEELDSTEFPEEKRMVIDEGMAGNVLNSLIQFHLQLKNRQFILYSSQLFTRYYRIYNHNSYNLSTNFQ